MQRCLQSSSVAQRWECDTVTACPPGLSLYPPHKLIVLLVLVFCLFFLLFFFCFFFGVLL
jgi:hypothetical protein